MPVLKLTFVNGDVHEFPFAQDSTLTVESTVWEDGSPKVKHGVWAEVVGLEVFADPPVAEEAVLEEPEAAPPVTFAELERPIATVTVDGQPAVVTEIKTGSGVEFVKPVEIEPPPAARFFGRSDR